MPRYHSLDSSRMSPKSGSKNRFSFPSACISGRSVYLLQSPTSTILRVSVLLPTSDSLPPFFESRQLFRQQSLASLAISAASRIETTRDANARNPECKTSANGVGVYGCWGGTPFPIPKNGYEAMWNHLLFYTTPGEFNSCSKTCNLPMKPPSIAGHAHWTCVTRKQKGTHSASQNLPARSQKP